MEQPGISRDSTTPSLDAGPAVPPTEGAPPLPEATEPAILQVADLEVSFATEDGWVRAVDGVSLSLARGRTLCLVGESGCGKTVTGLSIMRLLAEPPGRIGGGRVLLDGVDLLTLRPRQLRALRGRRIAMIFQEPMTSLNPAFTIGEQIAEVIRRHERLAAREVRRTVLQLLARVGFAEPERQADDYPHRLSGGMRQRVMIAIAIACRPDVLIADEPTTALDVTVQAEILALLADLQREYGMALLLITHDLGVVAEVADEVAVMYAGRIVEQAPAERLFRSPEHPYTVGLIGASPGLHQRGEALSVIQGTVPAGNAWPPGCRFHTRCPFAIAACAEAMPKLAAMAPGHQSACIRAPLERLASA